MMTRKKSLKIGIQGVKSSFHDLAAHKYFEEKNIKIIESESFKDLCENLKNNKVDLAVMAIENTIAGSILPNYSLIERYEFKIIGETYLRIEFALMALAGQKLKDIKFVQSHPMAFYQCEDFLYLHPKIKMIESSCTAGSAKDISINNKTKYAAIAPEKAAKTYGLEILYKGIETNKMNYTRFLILSRKQEYRPVSKANKSSLRFETFNIPGSLAKVLNMFKEYGINLTKIQSVPILGKPYEYSMHVDLEWNKKSEYMKAVKNLSFYAKNPIYFGEYEKGKKP